MKNKLDIAVIGMAVMGRNLALNISDQGYRVAIYNRTAKVSEQLEAEYPQLTAFYSLESLVKSLAKPRKIILMIKAGKPVDDLISSLVEFLDQGDIIIDGGNSYFKDTMAREQKLSDLGINYMGLGISGGEEGARFGPALMPGAKKSVYLEVKDILDKIAAKYEEEPCSIYMGENGAGHFVKMVHNGIEYADMALIAESYHLLKNLDGLSNKDLAQRFYQYNEGLLQSYLIEITAQIFENKDPLSSGDLIDSILDLARQKGTGKWTNLEAISLGVDCSVLAAGINSRFVSEIKAEREELALVYGKGQAQNLEKDQAAGSISLYLESALLLAKIIAYAQGFALYKKASAEYAWNLNYEDIASNFRAGCIIRSRLLDQIMAAFQAKPQLSNLLQADYFAGLIQEGLASLRKLVSLASLAGIAIPAFASALSYFEAMTTAKSPANLIQAQRDFFGAHTFERVDRPGSFHHDWD